MNKVSRMISAVLLCVAMMLSFAVFASGDSDDNAGNGKKVYFAGPMFNHAEKDFNLKITNVLEECGDEVFLPQRDGSEAALLEGKSEEGKNDFSAGCRGSKKSGYCLYEYRRPGSR